MECTGRDGIGMATLYFNGEDWRGPEWIGWDRIGLFNLPVWIGKAGIGRELTGEAWTAKEFL